MRIFALLLWMAVAQIFDGVVSLMTLTTVRPATALRVARRVMRARTVEHVARLVALENERG